MPKTRLIGSEPGGSIQSAMPGNIEQTCWNTSGFSTAWRSAVSTSGTARVMEKQPLSPGKRAYLI